MSKIIKPFSEIEKEAGIQDENITEFELAAKGAGAAEDEDEFEKLEKAKLSKTLKESMKLIKEGLDAEPKKKKSKMLKRTKKATTEKPKQSSKKEANLKKLDVIKSPDNKLTLDEIAKTIPQQLEEINLGNSEDSHSSDYEGTPRKMPRLDLFETVSYYVPDKIDGPEGAVESLLNFFVGLRLIEGFDIESDGKVVIRICEKINNPRISPISKLTPRKPPSGGAPTSVRKKLDLIPNSPVKEKRRKTKKDNDDSESEIRDSRLPKGYKYAYDSDHITSYSSAEEACRQLALKHSSHIPIQGPSTKSIVLNKPSSENVVSSVKIKKEPKDRSDTLNLNSQAAGKNTNTKIAQPDPKRLEKIFSHPHTAKIQRPEASVKLDSAKTAPHKAFTFTGVNTAFVRVGSDLTCNYCNPESRKNKARFFIHLLLKHKQALADIMPPDIPSALYEEYVGEEDKDSTVARAKKTGK